MVLPIQRFQVQTSYRKSIHCLCCRVSYFRAVMNILMGHFNTVSVNISWCSPYLQVDLLHKRITPCKKYIYKSFGSSLIPSLQYSCNFGKTIICWERVKIKKRAEKTDVFQYEHFYCIILRTLRVREKEKGQVGFAVMNLWVDGHVIVKTVLNIL